MNKKVTYLLLLLFLFGTSAFVVLKYNHKLKIKSVAFYPLQERNGPAADLPEWAATKEKGASLIRLVRETPEDTKSTIALATIYIQEARITGNYAYYDAAAMKYIGDVLEKEPRNFEALVLKSILQLSQHHFSEALETVQNAKKVNPYNAYIWGIMVDAYVELGDYKAAVEAAEKMMDIRPDLSSYSRASYLREIYGDYKGAIEAMKWAVEAGADGDEPTSWARIQLARLYELTGDLQSAEMHYTIALQHRSGYSYALAGLGHISMGKLDYKKAIDLYQQATKTFNDYGLKEQLAELYLLTDQNKKATDTITAIINELTKASEEGEGSINHHADRELAYVYLLNNKFDKALDHALAEYNRRPNNIDVNEAVAWAYFKKERFEKAVPFIENALRTNSKNPVLLCRAGLIYFEAGNIQKAKDLLTEGLKNNPNINPVLKKQSATILQKI